MKKFVFASVMALAGITLASALTLEAQDISIKDPAEFNAWQLSTTQNDAKAKAAALEDFLQKYPQSVVKKLALIDLVEAYQSLNDNEKVASAASRALQVDPNNMEAIYAGVAAKKALAGRNPAQAAELLDDAALLAKKGLALSKPAEVAADAWKKQTDTAFPLFHSALAYDESVSKKNPAAAAEEFKQELLLLPAEQTQGGSALNDTLQLAEAYVAQKPADMVNGVWFYARAWNFAPDSYKPVIEKKLKYWYNKFHGGLDGLDDIKAKAHDTVFPAGLDIKPAKTPAEFAHDVVTAGGLEKLNLSDKEFILANGSLPSTADPTKLDADVLWAVLKNQNTPVPGIVIEASTTVIKVAVSDDAKQAKVADFVVNLKKPIDDKDVPAVGFEYKIPPASSLIGIYDSFTKVAATATTTDGVQIVLRDGDQQIEKKKAATPTKKPAAAHKKAH
jgi:hypothetical protein